MIAVRAGAAAAAARSTEPTVVSSTAAEASAGQYACVAPFMAPLPPRVGPVLSPIGAEDSRPGNPLARARLPPPGPRCRPAAQHGEHRGRRRADPGREALGSAGQAPQ